MGVPKFYRWLSERYPMVNQQLEHGAPTLDNLYLDMNGIIHNCTHANEGENVIKSGKDENEMMLKIFAYIDSLFQMIKPRKVFFMAPTLDNLYLDMNGIIHNCTHANEGENVIKS